jgi:hypothetical protein
MAELDPVAELAESVSELEEAAERAEPGPADPAPARPGEPRSAPIGTHHLASPPAQRPLPLGVELPTALDRAIEAELAAELRVGTRRSPGV